MNRMAGINRQRWLFIINRVLLALATLLIAGVLLYAPWRREVMSEVQMVLINARLL